jgi:hypothetical protein
LVTSAAAGLSRLRSLKQKVGHVICDQAAYVLKPNRLWKVLKKALLSTDGIAGADEIAQDLTERGPGYNRMCLTTHGLLVALLQYADSRQVGIVSASLLSCCCALACPPFSKRGFLMLLARDLLLRWP